MSDDKTRIIQSNGALDRGVGCRQSDKTAAADLFPKLTKTLLGADREFGIDFAYFRLSR